MFGNKKMNRVEPCSSTPVLRNSLCWFLRVKYIHPYWQVHGWGGSAQQNPPIMLFSPTFKTSCSQAEGHFPHQRMSLVRLHHLGNFPTSKPILCPKWENILTLRYKRLTSLQDGACIQQKISAKPVSMGFWFVMKSFLVVILFISEIIHAPRRGVLNSPFRFLDLFYPQPFIYSSRFLYLARIFFIYGLALYTKNVDGHFKPRNHHRVDYAFRF